MRCARSRLFTRAVAVTTRSESLPPGGRADTAGGAAGAVAFELAQPALARAPHSARASSLVGLHVFISPPSALESFPGPTRGGPPPARFPRPPAESYHRRHDVRFLRIGRLPGQGMNPVAGAVLRSRVGGVRARRASPGGEA